MVLKVFGHPKSTCTARVLVCLEEVGAEYELVPVDLAAGEHKTPAYLSRNPFGQVPALEDGNVILFESRAISKYILRKYKANSTCDLLKEGKIEESSMVDQALEMEAHHYNLAISPIVYQCLIIPMRGGSPDLEVVEASVEASKKVLDVYETRLSTSKYLAGDFFSFADVSHFPYTHYLMATPYASLVESRPHVKAWWEEMAARPAVVKVAAAMGG